MKVGGKWAYLYRATDEEGQLVDALLSESRDMEAAQEFFKSAKSVVGHKPSQATTGGHVACRPSSRKLWESECGTRSVRG